MKKILSVLTVVGAMVAGAATVESTATFGVLRVDSSAAQTIVSVPWLGADGNAVKVKDVVKTSNLTAGDQLYCYANGSYKLWVLADGAWAGATTVMNGIEPTAGSDTDALARGDALILIRGESSRTKPIYLYGRHTGDSATVTCAAAQTVNGKLTPAYTLLAPPTTGDYDLNASESMTGTPSAGDFIIAGSLGVVLTYTQAHGWAQKKTTINAQGVPSTTYNTANAKISAGTGVWYVSTGLSVPTFHF